MRPVSHTVPRDGQCEILPPLFATGRVRIPANRVPDTTLKETKEVVERVITVGVRPLEQRYGTQPTLQSVNHTPGETTYLSPWIIDRWESCSLLKSDNRLRNTIAPDLSPTQPIRH